eukprot:457158_1
MATETVVNNKEKNTNKNNDDNKIEEKATIKILVIDKGFGNSLQRMKHLQDTFTKEYVEKIIVTEPSDKSKYDTSVNKLIIKIFEYKPNVIIASSRGGYYAASLLNSTNEQIIKYINEYCTFLLLSAMDTQKCCIANKPILFYHANNDGITNINQLKQYCKSYPLSKLIIAEKDTHSLESLKG